MEGVGNLLSELSGETTIRRVSKAEFKLSHRGPGQRTLSEDSYNFSSIFFVLVIPKYFMSKFKKNTKHVKKNEENEVQAVK